MRTRLLSPIVIACLLLLPLPAKAIEIHTITPEQYQINIFGERASASLDVTVSGYVLSTSLVVNGYGPPNAFLTLYDDDIVVGTGEISADGIFTLALQAQGGDSVHDISLVADNGTQRTPAVGFVVTLSAQSQTTVSNVVMPTFIDVGKSQVRLGEPINILGSTVPDANVTLFISSPSRSAQLLANGTGNWKGDANELYGLLPKGRYKSAAAVSLPGGLQSILSREIEFEVIDNDACADRRSDLNCDGRVDIVDIGILIYYWGDAGSGQKADITEDESVDISDVGIMVYDWTY